MTNNALRHYYRCTDCLTVAATEQPLPTERKNYGPETVTAECGACGGRIEYMGPVIKVRRILTDVKYLCPCDERCTGARGPDCDCQCGGANHGTGAMVRVEITEGLPRLMVRPGARLGGAKEYRALLARVMDGWNWRYRAVTVEKSKRYLDPHEYDRYSEGQWKFKAIAKAKAMRTHKGRNRALATILKDLTGEQYAVPVRGQLALSI
jgi:hypothetical protein